MKICTSCREEKPLDQFFHHVRMADGLDSRCKLCVKKLFLARLEANPSGRRKSVAQWNSSEKAKDCRKRWRERNKVTINTAARTRRNNDINHRLAANLRTRLCNAIATNAKVGSAISDLGCSIFELREFLEQRFYGDMSWSNYGDIWQIDHKRPLSNFDLSDLNQVKKACHYTNLQPLALCDHRIKTASEMQSKS